VGAGVGRGAGPGADEGGVAGDVTDGRVDLRERDAKLRHASIFAQYRAGCG
jgi:hypothetical protein